MLESCVGVGDVFSKRAPFQLIKYKETRFG